MRKYGIFVLLAFMFALAQACSLDNDILKPDCEVFEVELTGKWWHPQGHEGADNIMFTNEGTFKTEKSAGSWTYELFNCSTVKMANNETGETDEWVIEDLNLDRLVIRQNQTSVHYSPK